MGEACRIAHSEMDAEQTRIRQLRDQLWQAFTRLDAVELNGHPQQNIAGILNVSFTGIAAEALLAAVPDIAISMGSACTSASYEPSHVLRAMGIDEIRARGAIRFSLGRFTTVEDINYTVHAVTAAVNRLRELLPLWEDHQRGVKTEVD